METYANPFAYLALPYALGLFSSIIIGIVVRAMFPVREIEKLLG